MVKSHSLRLAKIPGPGWQKIQKIFAPNDHLHPPTVYLDLRNRWFGKHDQYIPQMLVQNNDDESHGIGFNIQRWKKLIYAWRTVDGWNPANQLRLVVFTIIDRVSYIPGGVGFQPSTVAPFPDCWTFQVNQTLNFPVFRDFSILLESYPIESVWEKTVRNNETTEATCCTTVEGMYLAKL